MASFVWARVFGFKSVIAIREQPDRAKPLATAAPMPVYLKYVGRTAYQCVTAYQSLQRL
ncbi:bacilysin biosynthesis oxidoreductase bacC [Alternaria alternata]|nr:bacilysin biosynthesis oxidoreductase bacC [Alternaria alternata]